MLNARPKPTLFKPIPAAGDDDAALLAELSTLHQYVDGLPDLRIEKVFRVRRALRNGDYERPDVVDSLLDRMSNDIGVLCRRAQDE